MSSRTDWSCWEIMKCEPEQAEKCPAYLSNRPCWESMRERDIFIFNVCEDCIVYVIKQKDSIFSREEILNILSQKGVSVAEKEFCPGCKVKTSYG